MKVVRQEYNNSTEIASYLISNAGGRIEANVALALAATQRILGKMWKPAACSNNILLQVLD